MTKLDLERELKGGKKLVDLFTFTGGQECEIYKGDFSHSTTEDIVYIPDVLFNDIHISKTLSEEEIKNVLENCYTVQDFIRASQGHENVARALFVSVDWQHPNLMDFLLGYEEEDFREAFGFSMDDLEA